jgi:hypothetical protein
MPTTCSTMHNKDAWQLVSLSLAFVAQTEIPGKRRR